VAPLRRAALAKAFAAAAALPLASCATLGYYAQAVRGEAALLAARRPIDRMLADPAVDAGLKARLRLAQDARAFASAALGLPRNRSFTRYADLGRPYAVWNLFAAPEFSLEPLRHCFPFAGCVAYRGYFDRAGAEAEARRLGARGFDTWIGGVTAYSTLGWFADPILNTMLGEDDDALAATIFHELAHQELYVKDDDEFNESFAGFVEREGLCQWRAARGLPPPDQAAARRAEQFEALIAATRERLRALYASTLPPTEMRSRKHDEIERLRADYRRLRDGAWGGRGDYDGWIAGEINNAALVPFALYRRWLGSFAALYKMRHDDWAAFHAAARELARLDPAARRRALERLAAAE
jgi:predicted aminopeptidase